MTHSERLASRAMKLLAKGVFPLPDETAVTIILRSTRPAWTSACLETIRRCTSEPAKLIVVDDHSYDPELAGKDRLNLALSQVKTDFFVLLDDRVMVTPHWLTRILWTFFDDSAVGMAAPSSNLETDSAFCSDLDELFAFSQKIAMQNSGMWEPVHSLRGTCFVCRKSVLDRIGGLDPSLQCHTARLLDWCLRAKANGYRLALCKDAFVYVMQPISEESDEKTAEEANSWIRFRQKWNLAATVDPYSTLVQTEDPGQIPLTSEALAPPLVSVVVTCFAASLHALHESLASIEQQTYSNIEILLIRLGSPPRLPKLTRRPVAGLWIEQATQAQAAFEAVQRLARGRYIAYLEAGYLYRRDHISRLVDAIHRKRAALALAQSDAWEEIPLSCVMHVHPGPDPANLPIRFSEQGTCKLLPNAMPLSDMAKIPELTVRKVKS
ncbi:glycosyltransferase [Effusibacillus pohliae]|uniref:glycosyltransferase n=1 Tax=Effusibacillus pohliae TaxID=232270 RepID=UPI000382EA54|nr:glycosyltransferase [Effusibacillus pohliae]